MKVILTALGKDQSGITAKIASCLAENQVNIEDISQTIMQGFFTMIMLVNIENSPISLAELCEKFDALGLEIGVDIHLQSNEVFDAMHKI